jgi:hypothetical protein
MFPPSSPCILGEIKQYGKVVYPVYPIFIFWGKTPTVGRENSSSPNRQKSGEMGKTPTVGTWKNPYWAILFGENETGEQYDGENGIEDISVG